jgi:hypothetical protein
MRAQRIVGLGALLAVSCAAPPQALTARPLPPPLPPPAVRLSDIDILRYEAVQKMSERAELYEALVEEVKAVHQFSPNTWENLAPLTWKASVASLREVFVDATTESDLLAALSRFGNSLHDAHGGFQPLPPYRTHLTLPIVLAPEWDGDRVTMVVTESRAKGVLPGDTVSSYAGTPARELLVTYADRSNANQWRGIALGVAAWMTERPADGGDGVDGSTVTLGIHKRDGGETFANLTWSRGGWHGENEVDIDAPQYDRLRCAPRLPARKYPSYELLSHSATYCLYVSRSPKYAPFPVLRFFSFDFGHPYDAEAEYDHLTRALRALPAVRGIVLDLRDNGGGNDPNWVLDWFAPKPYLDLRTQVKKTPRIDAIVLEDVANLDDGWVDALVRAPPGAVVSRFLGCKTADCTDTRRVPLHRILPVPVALVVGPRCNSACDHFARVWYENGLGPITGQPSGGALTVLRLDYPIVQRSGKRLGSMRFAISLDYSPITGLPVEGLPLHVDVPVAWSWERRDVYDTAIVDAAIASLTK